jgi:lysophospholipase L1-like esterase
MDGGAWFNLTPDWRAGIPRALRRGDDFRWLHTGDSIATGVIGITSPAQHYVARASELIARREGLAVRRGLRTSGSGGRTRVSGTTVRAGTPGGLFGAGGWHLPAGGDGAVSYSRGTPSSALLVAHVGGAFRYRVDDGPWTEVTGNGGVPAVLSVRADRTARVIHVSALDDSSAHIIGFDATDDERPAVAWFTSGIGGARIADLHRALSANNELGYSTYAALAPDLLTIGIGVNDTIHADVETLAGSARALRSLLARFRAHGVTRVALVGANPVRGDFQPGPWRVDDAYATMYRPVALEFGVPLLEVARAWGDYDTAREAGFIVDQVHPTRRGHTDIARGLASALSS